MMSIDPTELAYLADYAPRPPLPMVVDQGAPENTQRSLKNNRILKNESEHFANHNENEEEEAEDHNENEEEEAEHFANHINEDEHSAARRRN
jgi:TATA-binding protein-associated factor Taf7